MVFPGMAIGICVSCCILTFFKFIFIMHINKPSNIVAHDTTRTTNEFKNKIASGPYLVAPQIGGRLSSVLSIPLSSVRSAVSRFLSGRRYQALVVCDDRTTMTICQQFLHKRLCSQDCRHLLIIRDYLKPRHNEPPNLTSLHTELGMHRTRGFNAGYFNLHIV